MSDHGQDTAADPTSPSRAAAALMIALTVAPAVLAAWSVPAWVPVCILAGIAARRHLERDLGCSAVGSTLVSLGLCITAWHLRAEGEVTGWWWPVLLAAVLEPFSRTQNWEYRHVRRPEGVGRS